MPTDLLILASETVCEILYLMLVFCSQFANYFYKAINYHHRIDFQPMSIPQLSKALKVFLQRICEEQLFLSSVSEVHSRYELVLA